MALPGTSPEIMLRFGTGLSLDHLALTQKMARNALALVSKSSENSTRLNGRPAGHFPMSFEGFTFSSTGAVSTGSKADRPELDMDLNEIVKRNRAARSPNRGPNSRLNQRQNQRNQKNPKNQTGPPGKNPNRNDQGTNKTKSGDNSGKRSFDIDVPEAALKQILQGAAVTVPDGTVLKLIAVRKDKPN
jgi:hypothetical protein